MSEKTFTKRLTANDTGESGAHQAGIHVPKGESELLSFLPALDASTKNPDKWLACVDAKGREWSFRYVYYNNKLHDSNGTRDEYRITHMTKFFKVLGASAGDYFQITGQDCSTLYKIDIVSNNAQNEAANLAPIKLSGWSRVH
nr:EcoRII N-terminal effector-binding domain-containing protein [uncultured Roseibium sp.]